MERRKNLGQEEKLQSKQQLDKRYLNLGKYVIWESASYLPLPSSHSNKERGEETYSHLQGSVIL